MTQEPATPAAPETAERRFESPLRAWELVFLLSFAASIIAGVCLQSAKAYLNNDELLTAVLVSNPSFSQMWNTIRHGGELNPPLFFVLEWLVAHTCGTSELALRAISAVSVALSGWVLFFTVRPLTGPRIAALAVALVLGLSREVFFFAGQARYYGLLLLLVSLAAFLSLRFDANRPPGWRGCFLVFLANCALAYLHLYGLLYGGVILAAMIVSDWLRQKPRWRLYGAVVAAWVAFVPWIPSMRQQLKSVSGGVFVPPGMLTVGMFLDDLMLATPLAFVFIAVVSLGALSLISVRPGAITEEANACSAPMGWASWMSAALGLFSVPIVTWTASHWMYPPPYMLRYMFPCIVGWVFIIGFALLGAHRLPRSSSRFSQGLPCWIGTLAWIVVLVFCMAFQPMRARKNPARPAAPFVEEDYGYKNLPVVFENSWFYLQRAWYRNGREHLILIDHDAAEADPGWYTKNIERELKAFSPRYNDMTVLYYDELPNWPDGFLAVDDDFTKTFEWIFAHRPELKTQLLGKRMSDPPIFGEQRIYLVQKR